jgi:hypothetical protein
VRYLCVGVTDRKRLSLSEPGLGVAFLHAALGAPSFT